jgi:nucleotide-binding universal stress UspA family protein
VLFRQQFWAGLADGSVTLAFRRWKRPTVKAGGRQTTPAGVLAIDDVRVIEEGEITEDDARLSGLADRAALFAELAGREGQLYRIEFHLAGEDPRIALRERAELSADDVAELTRRLSRLDGASTHGPWTESVLRLIAARPGVRAGDLAESLGRERLPFKADVRKLKALGLTESLQVGYRLSPRGEAWLARRP